MDRHRTEYALTNLTLAESLPTPPAHTLDCGSGPGAMLSIWPARATR